MCMTMPFISQRIRRVVLTKPKTVYKVMRKRKLFNYEVGGYTYDENIVVSPHQRHAYLLGETQRTSILVSGREVFDGFHSFASLADAITERDECQRTDYGCGNRYGVYRCEIPRWATYLTGFWDYHFPEKRIPNIVSSALIVVEEVTFGGCHADV